MRQLIFLLFFLPALLAAQTCDYDKLYREGKTFAKQRQYKKALYKFNSARRCDPTKGETVDAAIEALLDQVEGEKKAADKERERAEQALSDLRQTSGKVVESLLRDAEKEVYHLRYAEALEKMNAAADIGQKKPEVARALMEIAFFDAESGQFLAAQAITTKVSQLLGKDTGPIRIDTADLPATRHKFRQVLQELAPARYAELEARYYPVMIDVKGGEFIMGCEKGKDCDRLSRVKLSDYQLARTETTFWQFALYAKATGLKIQDFSPAWGLDGDNPVVNILWVQTLEYGNWLSVQQGLQPAYGIDSLQIIPNAKGYCLPTVAEWEYAAKGGTRRDTFLYSGSDNLATVAWYDENVDTLGVKRTRPVATRLPNGLDLRDMSGNVREWCWDYYQRYLASAFENPTGPTEGEFRVLRGGSWGYNYNFCLVANRDWFGGNVRDDNVGFRLARH
jgi:sulfatase modifying factor 1